jgi:hypothetical protein
MYLRLTDPQLSEDMPYRRLHAVQKLIPKDDGWETRLQELQLVSVERPRVVWDQLQRSLEELSDELQQFGEDILDIEKPQLPTTSPDAAAELRQFAERIFYALSCNKCLTKSPREVRLKIGTYRKGEQSQGSNYLCTLLARDSSQFSWHEVLIHDTRDSG